MYLNVFVQLVLKHVVIFIRLFIYTKSHIIYQRCLTTQTSMFNV